MMVCLNTMTLPIQPDSIADAAAGYSKIVRLPSDLTMPDPAPRDYWALYLAPIWSFIELIAETRENDKRSRDSTHDWRNGKSTHLPGVAGEIGFALLTGKTVDGAMHTYGDAGYDAADGTDIKTTVYWPPVLKVPQSIKCEPLKLALMYLNEESKIVHLIGIVTWETFLTQHRIETFNVSAGPQRVMNCIEVTQHSIWRSVTPAP